MLCAICLAHLLALRVEFLPDGGVLWSLEPVEQVLAEGFVEVGLQAGDDGGEEGVDVGQAVIDRGSAWSPAADGGGQRTLLAFPS